MLLTLWRLGDLNLCIAWEVGPPGKGLRERVEMNVHSPIFQGQLIEKKLRPIILIVCELGKVEKNAKKKVKKGKKYFFCFKQITKCDTCF